MPARFISWCRALGATSRQAEELSAELVERYGEPHRHYHTLEHIHASLLQLDRLAAVDPSIEGAIWFHDLIYDPHRSDNEDASAARFRELAEDWLAAAELEKISELIKATDPRSPRGTDPQERLLVDIDLSVLGSEPADYRKYCKAIRQEYAHVSDSDFKQGRATVLARFLESPIFLTKPFRRFEARARENISVELRELR